MIDHDDRDPLNQPPERKIAAMASRFFSTVCQRNPGMILLCVRSVKPNTLRRNSFSLMPTSSCCFGWSSNDTLVDNSISAAPSRAVM